MKDEIIVFVNKIVKIIHECTKRWDGMPTKNYGDKFLLTWRMPKLADAIDLIKAENDEDSSKLEIEEKEPDMERGKGGRQRARNGKIAPTDDGQKESARDEGDALIKGETSDATAALKSAMNGGIINEDDLFTGLTQVETMAKRTEIADKAVIAAVKTIAELARA